MADEIIGPWIRKSSELKYENPWISVFHDEVIHPSGNPGIYGKVHFKNIAVGCIPIDTNGYTWLVGQYRYPLNRYSWEIPEGGSPEGESKEESARRELLEEVGLTAGKLTPILEVDLSNSVSDETGIVYLATNLKQGQAAPEESEELTVKKLHWKEALEMVLRGEITDSLSVAALLKLGYWDSTGRTIF